MSIEKFNVLKRGSSDIAFTAEIDTNKMLTKFYKREGLGLAVKWARERNIPLTGLDLSGIVMRKFNLSDIDLSKCNLDNSLFYGCELIDANLSEASLVGADFTNCDLTDAYFRKSNLMKVDFWGSNLLATDLSCCNLKRTRFNYTQIDKAEFYYSDLRYAKGLLRFGPVGNNLRMGNVSIERKPLVNLGCFHGREKRTLREICKGYKNDPNLEAYVLFVRAACEQARQIFKRCEDEANSTTT